VLLANDPPSIGVLSTGEACAVALLLVRSIYSTAAITRSGVVTGTVAGCGSTGKMADDDLVCPHQFPPTIIRHAVWLYVRFTLSYRDVEDLLAERGLDVSYETVRRWVWNSGRCSPESFAIDAHGQRRGGISTRWP
jgi:hypothetical protein